MSAAETILKVLDSDPELKTKVVSQIVEAVDARIADLQAARSDLEEEAEASPAQPATPKRRGRPVGSKNKKAAKKTAKKGKAKGGKGPGHTDKLIKAFGKAKAKKGTATELRDLASAGPYKMDAGTFHSTVNALITTSRVTKTGEGREAVYKLVK
jgi:hypothetical protein